MASNVFQRSPSKVWWAQDISAAPQHPDWNNRTGSGSPNSHKSQDSGFSDSEISPNLGVTTNSKQHQKNNQQITDLEQPVQIYSSEKIQSDILKDNVYLDVTPQKNFTENLKEKCSSKKTISNYFTDEMNIKSKSQRIYERHNPCCRSLPTTPNIKKRNCNYTSQKCSSQSLSLLQSPISFQSKKLTLYTPVHTNNLENEDLYTTTPVHLPQKPDCQTEGKQYKIGKYSPKVNRNLLNCFPTDSVENVTKDLQQISSKPIRKISSQSLNKYDVHTSLKSPSLEDDDSSEVFSISLPPCQITPPNLQFNMTVPLYYKYNLNKIGDEHEGVTSFNSSENSSDECISTANDTGSFDNSTQNEELSDCEREIESFFPEIDRLEPPTHTSTPKVNLKRTVPFSLTKETLDTNEHLFETIERVPNVNVISATNTSSVQCWLNEVEIMYEPECMTTLQSKSIAAELAHHVNRMGEKITAPIKDTLGHARVIIKEFNKIKMQLASRKCEYLGPLTQSLSGNITEYVLKNVINSQINGVAEDAEQRENSIHRILDINSKLRHITASSNPKLDEVNKLLFELQDIFYITEHNILGKLMQSIVNLLEESNSHLTIRAALSGITSLALQCEKLNSLVVQCRGSRALLILCVECKASTIRTMALRTLATISCSTAAIRQLEQADGVEILADILSDNNRPEPEISEATAVLAQITAPWIEDNHSVQGLAENMAVLIGSITDFLQRTKCCQNLLLCAAALANLTYMNINPLQALVQHDTINKLLSAVRNRGPKASVFLKEQTATLIANLSDIMESRAHLSENNAGVALLCFLQVYPVHSYDEAERNAAQRLQQKSAIALSRLCSDIEVAKQIVELGGVNRLVQLCKEGRERNYSDAVLVACLATLRKIVANCGNEVMDQQDIMELVEPRLLDSFLAYSSQNESYV